MLLPPSNASYPIGLLPPIAVVPGYRPWNDVFHLSAYRNRHLSKKTWYSRKLSTIKLFIQPQSNRPSNPHVNQHAVTLLNIVGRRLYYPSTSQRSNSKSAKCDYGKEPTNKFWDMRKSYLYYISRQRNFVNIALLLIAAQISSFTRLTCVDRHCYA